MGDDSWIKKASVLGIVFFLGILLVKPIGVSTQFSVLSGIFHSALDDSVIVKDENRETGYRSTNAYYDKGEGKLAKSIQNPWNYDFVFVLAIPAGGYFAYIVNDKKRRSQMSDVGQELPVTKSTNIKSYIPSFLGGMLILFAARMADGCTSGHMMSGIMQGSISGYIFAICVFIVAIPTVLLVGYKTSNKERK
ncbi:MAG: YeeE/YedE thiosulfate transporter family protein [Thomasclavelia sp.]|uniref:YeeE/YedE thiosulfate transporter family protein n=1 Tax=Thomasclavelia sp. TaxID=3025757 RepID=UPI00399FD31C